MSTITIKIKIEMEDEVVIDIDDLMHQSIEDYMDDVLNDLSSYTDIENYIEWELA